MNKRREKRNDSGLYPNKILIKLQFETVKAIDPYVTYCGFLLSTTEDRIPPSKTLSASD